MERKVLAGLGISGLLVVLLISGLVSQAEGLDTGRAAIIQFDGAISASGGGSFQAQGTTPSGIRELNERALNQGASSIIYEINSGGGAVVASKEIKREIESVEVPTVCRFRDISASGAYLASLGCDRIVADSATFTGSIGVRSSYMEYSGLMEKLGIDYVNITSGRYKDLGSPYRNASDQEKRIIQEKADIVHEDFVNSVRESRNLTDQQVEEVRTGEIFLGTEALELGLVDVLGGRETAVSSAENLTGRDLNTFEVETQQSLNLFSLLSAESFLTGSTSSPLRAVWR